MSSTARAITNVEFKNALHSICGTGPLMKQWHLGLAISGGVDSMALAYLARQWQLSNDNARLTAFIIDHRLRRDSAFEARLTKSRLMRRGIDAEILTIEWPRQPQADKLETEARSARLRLLMEACQARGIRELLLGHHRDDNVETFLIRLVKGYHKAGLRGIAERRSFSNNRASSPQLLQQPQNTETAGGPEPGMARDTSVSYIRPLLAFPKPRLIATCEEAELAWSEDETNVDATLTIRNAIRHIYQNHTLPEALSPDRVIRVTRAFQDKTEVFHKAAQKIYDACAIFIDVQSGSVQVQLPPTYMVSSQLKPDDMDAARRHFATMLIAANSPLETWPTNASLEGAGTQLFSSKPEPFTDRSLCFVPEARPRKLSDFSFFNQGGQTWRIYRQPPSTRAKKAYPYLLTSAFHTRPLHFIFDNRFCFTMLNRTHYRLVLRLFSPKHDFPRWSNAKELLRALPTDKARSGIPVLAYVDVKTAVAIDEGKTRGITIAEASTPVALPTYNLWNPTTPLDLKAGVNVQVNYKHVNPQSNIRTGGTKDYPKAEGTPTSGISRAKAGGGKRVSSDLFPRFWLGSIQKHYSQS